MPRLLLTDAYWSKLQIILQQFSIYIKLNTRTFIEAVLYRIRTGIPWRDLPPDFGKWNSTYKRFNQWSIKGIWHCIFKQLVDDPDFEFIFTDASYIKAHQHSMGAASNHSEAIGVSVGGNTTKIHMLVDAMGLPIQFIVTGGNIAEVTQAAELILSVKPAQYTVADRGYDKEQLREDIKNHGSESVIPRKKNSLKGNDDIDFAIYKDRHLVENVFARLKHFRGFSSRYDKLERNFTSVVSILCAFLWLPM